MVVPPQPVNSQRSTRERTAKESAGMFLSNVVRCIIVCTHCAYVKPDSRSKGKRSECRV